MRHRSLLATALSLGYLACLSSGASGADWTQFRGPGGRAQSSETGLPTTWSADENIVWKTALPGPGASSPVTFGGRVYLTCYSGYGLTESSPGEMQNLVRHLICVDPKTGKIVWDKALKATGPDYAYQGFMLLHGYASSTPAVDENGVYVFFGTAGAAAFSHQGEQLWVTPCGNGKHEWGSGTSPVLYKNLVIINASVESQSLIALDTKTGKEAWRQPGMNSSWNSPVVVKNSAGEWELAVQVQGQVLGYNPLTGEKLWNCKGIDDYICPTLLEQDGVLYAVGGRQSKVVAIKLGGRGDVSQTHRLWELKKGSNVSSPVFHEGYLYWAHDTRNSVYCANAKTGKLVYEERLDPNAGKIYASPLLADGKLYYVSRDKGAFVVQAQPEFKLLAHNTLATDSSTFNASPIVLDGKLLLRSDKYLYCLGK